MSRSESRGYRRDNWWGRDDPEVRTVADDHHEGALAWPERTQEKARHVAHLLLSGVAPALCSTALADPSKTAAELGLPEHYPPGRGNRTHMRAIRANDRDGYLTGGESTGVVLDGTPTDEFLSLVRTWLAHCRQQGLVGDDRADALFRDAQSMKAAGDDRDQDILATLVRDVMAGESPDQ